MPVVAAWLAGLAGAEVALRAGRVLLGLPAGGACSTPARSTWSARTPTPAVGPTLAFVAVAALGLATPPGAAPAGADPAAG